ncbi:MAG: site-specific integrase [Sediminibacterium sp.]|jgi:site-specific recombinase XerD|nr:site-specific integrase [Sediminibacterium sp.]
MAFSVKLKINTQRQDKNGEAALFFQVLINSKKTTVALDLSWDVRFFDEEKGILLARSKKDADIDDYQMLIDMKRNDINEVFKFYRLANKILTIEVFKAEINNVKSRLDFIEFWRKKIQSRFDEQLISRQTMKNNNSSLKMLLNFRQSLLFKDINKKTIEDFRNFIRRQISPTGKHYRINTIAKYLSDLKTYLEFAKQEGIVFENPFTDIQIQTAKGSIVYLNYDELMRLWKYFQDSTIPENHQIVLRPFLFACLSGLRHSDLERITWREIRQNNELQFEPYKTRELQKSINVPLCGKARELIQTKSGKLFKVYSNQKANEILKKIASNCQIFKNLTTHVARHTFATQFLESGGKLEVLKELLGHTKIETTMIYVHVTDEQKRKQINLLDKLFEHKKAS